MKRLKYIILLSILICTFSCNEDLLVEDPPHFASNTNLYTTVSGFESSLNGLYGLVRNERAPINGMLACLTTTGVDNLFGNFSGDEFFWGMFRLYGEAITPSNLYVRQMWELLYRAVNVSNIIVNQAEVVDLDWDETQKNRIIGEAKLIRAWAYRHLTGLWGDVPLNLESEPGKRDWTRTTVDIVREQMLTDLLFAEEHLPEVPINDHKVSKVLAQHYLAELYLTMEDYPNAIAKAQAAIANPNYHLITDRYGVDIDKKGTPFTDIFRPGNSKRSEGNMESLWAWENDPFLEGGYPNCMRRTYQTFFDRIQVDGVSPFTISSERGGRGLSRVSPTKWAWRIYEDFDDRIKYPAWRFWGVIDNEAPQGFSIGDTLFLDTTQIEGTRIVNWPSITKWDGYHPDNVTSSPGYEDQVYVRLAETYLILAEAQLKHGNRDGAATTLNILRERSNASPIHGSDVDIDFILDERSRELLTEEHRKYTLVRNNKFIERTLAHNPTVNNLTARDRFLPIPQDVIDANISIEMRQNEGY